MQIFYHYWKRSSLTTKIKRKKDLLPFSSKTMTYHQIDQPILNNHLSVKHVDELELSFITDWLALLQNIRIFLTSEPSQVKAQYFPIPRGSINLLLVIIYWHRVEGRCRKRERRKFEALEKQKGIPCSHINPIFTITKCHQYLRNYPPRRDQKPQSQATL